jgi:lincosamide and streptogramin A transport system ATP-binding/permease protein
MSIISVNNLTFSYESSYENIFENVSFNIDTDWKLGFIGRNGRGKTTFLKLLMEEYKYSGSITHSVKFDYFPFDVDDSKCTKEIIKNTIAPFNKWEKEMNECIKINTEESMHHYGEILDLYINHDGYIIDELIEKEINKLDVSIDVLSRPFFTLSNGERTKLILAALFLKKNNFLLIDEPTNHLDMEGRQTLLNYLKNKNGFILVSHDRYFIDNIVDHILSINKNNIEVQKGNFTSWQLNKENQDNYELNKNSKLKREISSLETSFRRTAGWSNLVEKSKIGNHVGDRGYVGHKAAKMMKRAKSIENRKENLIDDKKKLLKNIERADDLKIIPLKYHKNNLINIEDLSIKYGDKSIFKNVSFLINQGDRVSIRGKNGSGKSSILKLILGENINYSGTVNIGSGLIISYVSQNTDYLAGSFRDFCNSENIEESLFKALLSKLDFTPNIFDKDLNELSGGQKKKILIAKSLVQKAHLYIWDEPLNFIDVLSRIQIENLIKSYEPTMIFVEHDYQFNENIATKTIFI